MSANQNYIRQTIRPEESITTNARLHWIGYVSGMALPLLGWLATYYVPAIAGQPWAKWVMLGSLLLSAALLYLAHVEQATSEIVMTDGRLIGSVGHSLERNSFDIELAEIHGVNVSQSLLGRICGYGTVGIEHNKDMTTSIGDIDDPLQFQQKLMAALRVSHGTAPASVAA